MTLQVKDEEMYLLAVRRSAMYCILKDTFVVASINLKVETGMLSRKVCLECGWTVGLDGTRATDAIHLEDGT